MKREIDKRGALQNIQKLDQLLQLYALREDTVMEVQNLLSVNECKVFISF